jgi:ribosome-associated translation inhibitor RaiA
MTQILIQTKGFDLTQALEAACARCVSKLQGRENLGAKIEFFLERAGKKDDKACCAKIKIQRRGEENLFIAEEQADMYQAIRLVCKKAKQALDEDEK